LTKSASPTTYDTAGQIINYTIVARNDGNVTVQGVSISDLMLPVLTCTPLQPATLAPGQFLTCTGSYTIQAADITAGSVQNTATANVAGPQVLSATASTTVTFNIVATGHVAETGTTCQQFKAGTWGYLDSVFYTLKNGKIGVVSPGVFFYYDKVTAPSSGSFNITVAESNNGSWPAVSVNKDQIIAYDDNCNKLGNVTVGSNGGLATITFKNYTPGATYYFSVKYDTGSVVGFKPSGTPTVKYTFDTFINNVLQSLSTASVNFVPKK